MRRATLFGRRGVRTWGSRWLPPPRSNTTTLASLSWGLPWREPVAVWSTNYALRSVPRRSIRSNSNNNNNETVYTGPTRTGQAGSRATFSTARQPNKPFGQWSAGEVQQWLKDSDYQEFAGRLAKLTGKQLANLSKEDLQKELGNLVGSALYNEIQSLKAKVSRYRRLLGEGSLGSGEGLDPTNPVISTRVATCDAIIEQLKDHKACLIRAPPYSGKTSLAILLEDRLLKDNLEVHLCTMLGWTSGTVEAWLEKENLPPIASWTSLSDTFIIIDEAQMLYPLGSDHEFWQTVKKIQQHKSSCYVVLIAAYGERVTPSDPRRPTGTPITFDMSIGLETVRFTRQEFTEFLAAYSMKSTKGKYIPLSEVTRDRIFWMTNGHAGLVRETLRAIEDAFYPAARAGATLTDADIMRPLVQGSFTSRIRKTRAVPVIELGEEEKEILRKVLIHGSCQAPPDPLPAAYTRLIISGALTETEDSRLVFAAPIIRSIFLQHLYRSPLRHDLTADFDGFVLNSISRLNASVLKNSLSHARDRPLVERQWQVEYYKAATDALPENYISPDVGAFFDKSGDARRAGKLDFYVNSELGWAIELLRDGDKATEHEARFANDGLYKDIPIAKHALLDFRMTEPKGELRDHFWYIIVQSDFRGAVIRRKGQADQKVIFFGGVDK